MITCTFENGGTGILRHVVVDGIVLSANKILLVKRANKLTEGGKWGLPGGFVGRNETTIEAMQREIFEETGYEVENLKLYTIIDTPNRRNDDKQNVTFIYSCNSIRKVTEADSESSEQRWFDLNSLPDFEETAFDHLQIIKSFLKV